MGLIDVSVLKEWIENWFTKNRFYHPYAKNNNIPITELYDILEQMPTIEERKTGEWEQVSASRYRTRASYAYKCSACGAIYWLYSNYYYCPNCGADMRGEHHE